MDVAFSSAALAGLCNSEHRLTQRWGRELGRAVARRLLDLAATGAVTLERLPGAQVTTNRAGETIITFGDEVIVRGILSSNSDGTRAAHSEADRMLITSVDVQGRDQ